MPMGNKLSNETSDSDEEVDLSVLRGRIRTSRVNSMETDAVGTSAGSVNIGSMDHINPANLIQIETQLLAYEKISLIFLLFDSETAFDLMTKVVEGLAVNLLAKYIEKKPHDKKAVIEALSVIQNFHVLKTLGLPKKVLTDTFFPMNRYVSVCINKRKKFLYRMFEDMLPDMQARFLHAVAADLKTKYIGFQHLEMHFVYYQKIGYIKDDDWGNIINILKQIDFDMYEGMLNMFPKQGSANPKRPQRSAGYRHESYQKIPELNVDKAQPSSSLPAIYSESVLSKAVPGHSAYDINKQKPGVVLIIENEVFYTEPDTQYKDVLLKCSKQIDTRTGSSKDTVRLKSTFESLGFIVEVESNKTHYEILPLVRKAAFRTVEHAHSSFFVCILSHGLEGQIIGSNSVPTYVKDIKRQMCSPQLEGKPKVLILQSCQGDEVQKLNVDLTIEQEVLSTDCLTTDGPCSKVPLTSDFLEIWSTVAGYASIRNTTTGSWFIQSLCNMIDEHHDRYHLLEICTKLQSDISKMTWNYEGGQKPEVRVMVPETRTTLSKFFFLPQSQTVNR